MLGLSMNEVAQLIGSIMAGVVVAQVAAVLLLCGFVGYCLFRYLP